MSFMAKRISCESIGHSVGAVPFRSWLPCVRNLHKSENKKLALEQENSREVSRLAVWIDWDRLRYGRKTKWGKHVAT